MNTFPFYKKRFASGLRTIVLPRKEVQTVTFMVLIGVGSRYETPRQAGLSHFLEHMFFKGTTTRQTTKEIAEALDKVGGEFNAFTGFEYTGFYVKVAAEHFEHGAEVVSDILLRPLFPPKEIERERGVIVEEINMYTDMPMEHINHLWHKVLFGSHPLGRRIDGGIETVQSFMRKDFLRYTHAHYHTENALVVVAGNTDTDKAQELLQELFKPLAHGKETHPRRAPSQLPHARFVHEYRKHIDQTHVMVGAPGLGCRDKDRYAATLLATILGDGMSSRLFLRVRERNGLAYRVHTSSDCYVDIGSFVTQAGVRTDHAEKALRIILEEYDRVMDELVDEEELDKAKQMVRGDMVIQLEETNNMAMFVGGQELLQKKILTPREVWDKVQAVTPRDIRRVARHLLDPNRRALALLSPHQNTSPFEKLLIGR